MNESIFYESSLSLSATLSKNSLAEDMSLTGAFLEEALSREDSAITNEEIRCGDRILDTYSVRSEAISGGMGSVWQVHHENWDVDLAMKRPRPRFFAEGSERRKEEFVRECENWIDLGLHPNIVSCYYVREIGGVPTIFSEWMDGGSLRDRIADGSLYEGTEQEVQKRILDIAIQAARGLRYSHENHLLHQDMKPGNLLLTKNWEAKVADFGLAKAREKLDITESAAARATGYTITYCPLEQTKGGEAQEWMDTYAWALTVLEMYAGERFWKTGAEAFEILFAGTEENGSAGHFFRIAPPEELLEAFREDWQKGSGKWRDLEDLEQILTEIYRKLTGSEYFRKAYNAASHTADSLNNMALSYLDLGKRKEAETLWEKAASMEQGHPDTLYNQALYKWMDGQETDLYLLDEIDKITDPERRLELHRKAAVVRREVADAAEAENYTPPVNREDWTDLNSTEVGETTTFYEKGTDCDWILGKDDVTGVKPGRLFRVPHDEEKLQQEGGPSNLLTVHGIPSPSADGSTVFFFSDDRLTAYYFQDGSMFQTKKFRKDSVHSYCGGTGSESCYLGLKDGLYEYFYLTDEMRLLLPSDCGIYNLKLRCGGRILLVCDRQNRLMVMDTAGNEVLFTIPTPLPSNRHFNDWSEEAGTFDVAEQDTVLFFSVRNQFFRYSLSTGEFLSKETAKDPECLIWDYRGPYYITSRHNYCQIWDSRSRFCLRSYRAHSVRCAGFWPEDSSEEEELRGFFLKNFPARYRHFRLPCEPPEPVWSLCRIRSTQEQTTQDALFEGHIRESEMAFERGEYEKAYEKLSLARELPNRKNAAECLKLYDALYPHLKRGKLTDCTVIYDFGGEAFPNYAPPLGPDGSWLFKSVWRGEHEILSAIDGQCLRKMPATEKYYLSCCNTRLTCLVNRGGKNWAAEVYSLPEGETILSQELKSGKPYLELIRTAEGREVIAVKEPWLFSGRVRMYIDPEKGELTEKTQANPLIAKAIESGMPHFYSMRKLPNGMTAFLYEREEQQFGMHEIMDFYGESGDFLYRYNFKRPNRASSDDIIRPVLLSQGYLAAECGDALVLYNTSDFVNNKKPTGQALPLPAPFGDTSMSEDCRYLFNGGRVCRLEWELLPVTSS